MREGILTVLRYAVAAVAGYLVIAFCNYLTLDVLLGGFSYVDSNAGTLAVATLGAAIAGLVGGYLAAWIGGRRPVSHALAVLIILAFDTHFVVTSGISKDPLWFDLAAGTGLMAATVFGGFIRRTVRERAAEPSPA